MSEKKISLIIPVFNEEKNLAQLYDAIKPVVAFLPYMWEVLFVNDGSRDGSSRSLEMLAARDERVKVIEFTRNFGKEVAMSAGIEACTGEACIILDADLQHPVEKIPEFIKEWEKGSDVVVGVRTQNAGAGLMKRIGSRVFYFLMKRISDTRMVPHATDYRLLDRKVIDAFVRCREKNRFTRGLIDWLGFTTSYIYFFAHERAGGEPGYGFVKLARLALTSVVTHSLFPLRVAGYLGGIITLISAPLGLFILVEKYILHDPLGLNFTGTAMLAVFNMFLVGIVLICLGLMSFYIASIHREVLGRPLYVVRRRIHF